jgi:hypothetical protein
MKIEISIPKELVIANLDAKMDLRVKSKTFINSTLCEPWVGIEDPSHHEQHAVKGKTLSKYLNHPEWRNTCRCCGNAEISIFESNCDACKLQMVFTGLGRKNNLTK